MSAPEILKWVLLVFLAGFIGFFGKFLGKLVISLFQRKKEEDAPGPALPGQSVRQGPAETKSVSGQGAVPGEVMSRDEQKLLKKALKNEVKANKKSGKQ
ncbi:MAG TPA: hypothetical protein PK749_01860 [Deltaproteobacteria bacterium]|nr:hypothetical protein [Deltaproteobacteria bacterium]